MATDGVEKRLAWLDEQRRKDAEMLSRLQERVVSLEETVASGSSQAKTLAAELARLAGLAARIHQFDEAVAKHRQQVSQQLEQAEARRTQKEKDLEALRRSDQKELATHLDDLRRQLSVLTETRSGLEARRQEELRLARELDALEKRLDSLGTAAEEQSRLLVAMEEGRKQDSRRVLDLQSEAAELRGRIEALRGDLERVEDRVRREELRVAELAGSDAERSNALESWMESQSRRLVDFDREWKSWQRRFETFESQAALLDERMAAYEETYRAVNRVKEELEGILERLERRIGEVSEMHRLAQDRMSGEWTAFRADDQKRWNTYKLTIDEQWNEHGRAHEKLTRELQSTSENLASAAGGLASLQENSERHILELFTLVQQWAADLDRKLTEVR